MRKCAALLVTAVALAVTQNASQAGEHGIPLQRLAGGYSFTEQGSFAGCFGQSGEELCDTPGVVVVPVSALTNGQLTMDKNGNGCVTYTGTVSNLPVDATPPLVLAEQHEVLKLLDYDPQTGTGDFAGSNFSGGTCNGADFDNSGAIAGSTSSDHFVTSKNGERIDFIVTSFIDHPVNGIGDFTLSGTFLKQ